MEYNIKIIEMKNPLKVLLICSNEICFHLENYVETTLRPKSSLSDTSVVIVMIVRQVIDINVDRYCLEIFVKIFMPTEPNV